MRTAVAGRALIASALVLTEVPRALARVAPPSAWADGWGHLAAGIRLVDLDRPLLVRAAGLLPPVLRAADALHVATALAVGSAVTAVVAYDRRLIEAVRVNGLEVVHPGLDL